MLSTIGFFALVSAAIFAYRAAPRSMHEASLGRMSTQWIAEYRASRTS
jgi:hypothetical protein